MSTATGEPNGSIRAVGLQDNSYSSLDPPAQDIGAAGRPIFQNTRPRESLESTRNRIEASDVSHSVEIDHQQRCVSGRAATLPGRGYWARVDAGQKPYRPKLPQREPQWHD